jgi:hypothetical protein
LVGHTPLVCRRYFGYSALHKVEFVIQLYQALSADKLKIKVQIAVLVKKTSLAKGKGMDT